MDHQRRVCCRIRNALTLHRRQSHFANDLEAAFETGVWTKLVLRASDAEGVENIPPFQVFMTRSMFVTLTGVGQCPFRLSEPRGTFRGRDDGSPSKRKSPCILGQG
jgi:hypothetical protein